MKEKQSSHVPASSTPRDRGLQGVPVTCHAAMRPTSETKLITS